jgi:type II secretory ATPase GspE/PulE/Tfp pilus assembly ATPase PilB-like protein
VAAPHTLAVSVEEKIEFLLPSVTQVEVRRDLGQTYASTLRSALKHNPDIVMIGEIKDEETAILAASAASRGTLVLAGIKVASAAKAIQKMLSYDGSPLLLSAVLRGVVAQQVVRKVCPHCKNMKTLTRAEATPLEEHTHFGRILAALKGEGVVDSSAQWKEISFAEPKGCALCEGGYEGTVGIFEVLPVSAITRELILDEKKAKDPLYKEDMPLSLAEDAVFKAAAGQTTLDEVANLLNS